MLIKALLCAALVFHYPAPPLRIAVIGNSLVRHGPSEAIGWTGNWGMAATAEDVDFSHVLARGVATATGRDVDLAIIPAASFESHPDEFDMEMLPSADLYVLRLGDNVHMSADEFAPHYLRMAVSLKARAGRLVCVGMWYRNDEMDAVMRAGCDAAGGAWVPISDMSPSPGYIAGAQRFANYAVASHPGDEGHAEIARRLLAAYMGAWRLWWPMVVSSGPMSSPLPMGGVK